jgi:hypothetical protein
MAHSAVEIGCKFLIIGYMCLVTGIAPEYLVFASIVLVTLYLPTGFAVT